MTTTNATNTKLAENLRDSRKATFSGLIIRKKGRKKGGKVYGDDLVHVTMVTGFSYMNLVRRSLDILAGVIDGRTLSNEGVMAKIQARGIQGVTMRDVVTARRDLTVSLAKSLAGVNTSTTDHVYEPLVVDGEVVQGCRVYIGDKAAPKGTIYLQGLKIGQKILDPAPNGPIPPSNSRPDVIAKNILRSMLPIGRYVSYSLQPGDYVLNAGGVAALAADKNGVSSDPRAVQMVTDLLAA